MRKFKKQLLVFSVAAISMFAGAVTVNAATSGSCGDSTTWSYDTTTKTLTISGKGTVTSNEWQDEKQIPTDTTTVVVNEGVIKLDGWNMFKGFSSLTTVDLPDTLTTIGDYSFENCTSLKKITIPKNVTQAAYLFGGSALEEITFAQGAKLVPGFICQDASKLTKINIPKTVTKIDGWSAFKGCVSLSSITLPDSITSIGDYTFERCTSLKKITIPKNVTQAAYLFEGSALEEITFAQGAKVVPGFICQDASKLKKVNMPNSITKIDGWNAFKNCTSLTEITMPWYLKSIGDYTFQGCTSLKKVTIYQLATDISTYAFKGLPKTITICGKKGSTAQKYAKENGFKFAKCKIPALKGITYTSGNLKYKVVTDYINGKGTVMVTGMVKNAKSVTIPDKVKLESYTYKVVKINKKAFYKKSSLKKVTIKAKGITSIGKNAFAKINKKAVVKVPKSKYKQYAKMLKKAGVKGKMKIKK